MLLKDPVLGVLGTEIPFVLTQEITQTVQTTLVILHYPDSTSCL